MVQEAVRSVASARPLAASFFSGGSRYDDDLLDRLHYVVEGETVGRDLGWPT